MPHSVQCISFASGSDGTACFLAHPASEQSVALLPANFARLEHALCFLAGFSRYRVLQVIQKTPSHSGSGDVASGE